MNNQIRKFIRSSLVGETNFRHAEMLISFDSILQELGQYLKQNHPKAYEGLLNFLVSENKKLRSENKTDMSSMNV